MKKILFAFIILVLIGGQSNSYAAALPIEYKGAAYWGESHFWTAYPNDPRYEDHPEFKIVPMPTEFTPNLTAEDILAEYGRYRGPSPVSASSAHVAEECLGYYSGSTTCWKYAYNWAVERSITCTPPELPNKSYTQCVAPAEQYFVSSNDHDEPLPFDPLIGQCPSISTGNPINTTDGNKSRLESDFSTSGISPLKFTRHYNSHKNKVSDIGYNWRHNYASSLTANIHTQTVPYLSNDSNFSAKYGSAQEACESGWNDIKGQFSEPALANSNAVYTGSTCTIEGGASPLGSIAVRSDNGVSPNLPQDTVVIERAMVIRLSLH